MSFEVVAVVELRLIHNGKSKNAGQINPMTIGMIKP